MKTSSWTWRPPLITVVANAAHQEKKGYRFVADNGGEVPPFDWYNARFLVDFKVEILATGADITEADHNGIVNGAHSLISEIMVKGNGIPLYDCHAANHAVHVKNLLEYSAPYAQSQGTNEFFFLDTSAHPEERAARVATFNKGFALRKLLLGTWGLRRGSRRGRPRAPGCFRSPKRRWTG